MTVVDSGAATGAAVHVLPERLFESFEELDDLDRGRSLGRGHIRGFFRGFEVSGSPGSRRAATGHCGSVCGAAPKKSDAAPGRGVSTAPRLRPCARPGASARSRPGRSRRRLRHRIPGPAPLASSGLRRRRRRPTKSGPRLRAQGTFSGSFRRCVESSSCPALLHGTCQRPRTRTPSEPAANPPFRGPRKTRVRNDP